MPDYEIVQEELHKLTMRAIPLALVAFGVLVLLGQPLVPTVCSMLAGTAFALWNFYLLGCSAVRAVWQKDPARAGKIVTRSYVRRYVLTAVFLLAVIWSGRLNVPAAVCPLFFPKIIFMISNFRRKEEKDK